MKLIDHRKIIQSNPNAYNKDLDDDRLTKSILNHIREDFSEVRFDGNKKLVIKKIIILLFEDQENRPFFSC